MELTTQSEWFDTIQDIAGRSDFRHPYFKSDRNGEYETGIGDMHPFCNSYHNAYFSLFEDAHQKLGPDCYVPNSDLWALSTQYWKYINGANN